MSTLQVKQIESPAHPDFQACLSIYRSSFPPNERQEERVIIDRIKTGVATLYAGYRHPDAGNNSLEPISFALLFHLEQINVWLLDYFAVAPGGRGKGMGSLFLKEVFDLFQKQPNTITNSSKPSYLVLEVEHPDFGENQDERKKRIRFYQNAGAVILEDTRYLLPPLGDVTEPTEMKLMIYPAEQSSMTVEEIDILIRQLYQQVYNRGADDPFLQMIQQ